MRKTIASAMLKGKLATLLSFSIIMPPSWAKLPEPQELLQEYLRIDTSNPPGNEMRSARFLETIFKRHGIPVEVFDLGNGRANLKATLKGEGTKGALILLHHMDVVPAEEKFWKHPPFSGLIENGEVWGRGSIDIKGKGITDLMVLLRLKDAGIKLKRDIIYLAVADEEVGSLGARTMIKDHGELLKQARYLIDEGAAPMNDYFYVSLGEKSPLWLTLTFKGTPGHGSVPHGDNPVVKAVEAANRILKFAANRPLRVIPGTEKYLALNVKKDYLSFPGYKRNFQTSLRSKDFLKALARDPELNALLRDTVTITGLVGSEKINTIPNEAKVRIDCRLLPGTSQEEFLSSLVKVLGPGATMEIEEYYPALFTPATNGIVQALKAVVGEDKVITTLLTSSTDSSLFRALGIEVVGLETYPIRKELIDTAHGNNERLPVASLNSGIDLLEKLILKLDSGP